MTIEEAIKSIERHMDAHRMGEYPHIFIKETLDMAISALRAQQTPLDRSQWEGCEYCNDTLKNYRYINACDIGKRRLIYDTPQYCPMRGRPFTEAAWEELERRIKRNNEP